MKKLVIVLISVLALSVLGVAQTKSKKPSQTQKTQKSPAPAVTQQEAITRDGKSVILRSDGTWVYGGQINPFGLFGAERKPPEVINVKLGEEIVKNGVGVTFESSYFRRSTSGLRLEFMVRVRNISSNGGILAGLDSRDVQGDDVNQIRRRLTFEGGWFHVSEPRLLKGAESRYRISVPVGEVRLVEKPRPGLPFTLPELENAQDLFLSRLSGAKFQIYDDLKPAERTKFELQFEGDLLRPKVTKTDVGVYLIYYRRILERSGCDRAVASWRDIDDVIKEERASKGPLVKEIDRIEEFLKSQCNLEKPRS